MAEIHIEYDDIEKFSAFKFAQRIIEKAKDIADIRGYIDIRMDGFCEAEAKAIAGLIAFTIQQAPKRMGTIYGLRTSDDSADKIAINIHDTKLDTCEWNPGKQQMHIHLEGNSLPAYAMQNELSELHRYILSQPHPIHHNAQKVCSYKEILCESIADAQGLCKNIIIPLLESNNISFDFDTAFNLIPIKDSTQVYLQIENQVFQQLREREIGARGQSPHH